MARKNYSLEEIAAIKQLAPPDICICKFTMDESGNFYHNGRCRYSGPNDFPTAEIPYEYKEDPT